MKFKRLFDDFERHILNRQIRLIQNSWARIYRIKIAVRRSKHLANKDVKEIEDALFFQCEELMRVAVEICKQIDIPLEMLGGTLAKELERADHIDENGVHVKPEPPAGILHHLATKTTLMGLRVHWPEQSKNISSLIGVLM